MQDINLTVHPGEPVPHLKFYNKQQHCHLDSIWDEICRGLWKRFNPDNYLYKTPPIECLTFEPDALEYFPNIIALPAGFIWDDATERVKQDLYTPTLAEADERKLLNAIEQYLLPYRGQTVGVHLSGGLDSSIIIGLLDYFGIDFIPIGYTSRRFEARTERTIQLILAEKYPNSILLDLDDYTEFEDVDIPCKTQIPSRAIRFGAAHKLMPRLFKEHGAQTVFSGQGADSIFGDPIHPQTLNSFNIPALFELTEQEYYLYRPYGLRLEPFFSDHQIITQITNLRRGQGSDARKLWARQFFKKFIPQELVDYQYHGDFFGHSISGLFDSRDKIRKIFSQTHEITNNKLFSPKIVDNMDVFAFDSASYVLWCSKISYAIWLTSLFAKN
jgi:hypothetical protein